MNERELFANCTTLAEVRELSKLVKARISAIAIERLRQITKALDKESRAICSRWNRGDAVYFGVVHEVNVRRARKVDRVEIKSAAVHSYVGGRKARVWLVVPKGLGIDATDYGFPGKALRVYYMADIRRLEIGRTELDTRKRAAEKVCDFCGASLSPRGFCNDDCDGSRAAGLNHLCRVDS